MANTMTVSEAFRAAGHPVPHALLLRESNPTDESLWYSADDPFVEGESIYSPTLRRWCHVEYVIARLNWGRDYSNEPASAFRDALPACVRELIEVSA